MPKKKKLNRKSDLDMEGMPRLTRHLKPTHCMLKVQSFSTFAKHSVEKYESNVFESGGYKCKIRIYPKGSTEEVKNKFVSAYLVIDDFETSPSKRLFVKFILRAKDHFEGNKPVEFKGSCWFTRSQNSWGSDKFMDLNTLYDSGKYSYTNYDFVVEASVTVSSSAVINSV